VRLVTFRRDSGPATAGALIEHDGSEHVVDLSAFAVGPGVALNGLLDAGEGLRAAASAVEEVVRGDRPALPLREVELLAPIPRPRKLLAAAANYQAHITEAGLPEVDRSRIVPKLFMKPSTAVLAPGAALRLPTLSQDVDWELELGVVIGRRARAVPVEPSASSPGTRS
jgi:2-keto-4-pentenoate hydratase/2-oxohepta-3-ene-1,7-dioic acid hydratase in catechol pathway